MTYNVGDRVLWRGDPGTILRADHEDNWPYVVQFDDGGLIAANDKELEEA